MSTPDVVMAVGLSLMVATCLMGSYVTSGMDSRQLLLAAITPDRRPADADSCHPDGCHDRLAADRGTVRVGDVQLLKTFSAAVATALIEGLAQDASASTQRARRSTWQQRRHGGRSLDSAQSLGQLAHRVHEQALVLTSADLYRLMACVAIALLILIPLLPVRIYPPEHHAAVYKLSKGRSCPPKETSPRQEHPPCRNHRCRWHRGLGLHRPDDPVPAARSTNDAYVSADFTLVAPRVPGQIAEVLVNDNQWVKAGQLLVRLDDRDFRAAWQECPG